MPTLRSKKSQGGHGRIAVRLKRCLSKPHLIRGSLRNFDQLHLTIAAAMEDKQVTASIAKDEQVAVSEFGFFHGFLYGHGPNGYGVCAFEDVGLDDGRGGRKRMHGDLGAR